MPACDGGMVVKTLVRALCLAYGFYVDEFATIATFGEHYCAVDEGIDCVVFAQANVKAGVVYCATLTFDDVAGFGKLATKNLYTESLAF